MTDPVTRERHAREELARLARMMEERATDRRAALLDLYAELGTWQKVADATNQTRPAVVKAATQPHKKGTTP